MCVAIPPLPNMPSWHGAQLKKAQGYNFTFNFMVKLILIYKQI